MSVYLAAVVPLFDICLKVLQENIDSEYTF